VSNRAANLRGAIVMVIGVGSFAFMDAALKTLSADLGPMQISALRGLATLPIALLWVAFSGGFGQLVRVRFGLHLLRGVLSIASLAAFIYGLRTLPLSEAYAIFFVAPLLVTLFAARVLGERVGRARWLAVAVGFAGTLIVLRPTGGGALTLAGLAILAAAFSYAASAITVRILGRTDSTQSMVFWAMAMVSLGAGLLALPDWRPLDSGHLPAILALAATGSLGQWAFTEAFRQGQASFIAPFEYTALLWGILLDWALWHTLPRAATLAGAAVIAASGVYLLRRERVHVEAEHP
jgi:drug/metabolite transporter (DMT)-like permease